VINVFVPVCAPPPAGLISWWKGETNTLDSTGTNHGTLVNGATFTKGQVGKAFDLNASAGATVIVPDSNDLRLTNHFTIETWINARTVIGPQSLVAKIGGAGGNNGYQFQLYDSALLG